MKTKKCEVCGKIIEGFSTRDVDYRLIMHKTSHKKEEEKGECKE